MRALVWNNPYAAAMLHGKIETRTYPTKVRGEVLICTAKKAFDFTATVGISNIHQATRLHRLLKFEEARNLNGYAIAVATLVDCRPMTKEDADATYVGDYGGRYCWIFENVRRIEPFQWNFGKQGWAFVPDSEQLKIKFL